VKAFLEKLWASKQFRSLFISAVGATAAIAMQWLSTVDLGGTWGPIVGAFAAFAFNALKEWMKTVPVEAVA
jgi:hypothetical protein